MPSPAITTTPKTGNEALRYAGSPTAATLLDFWRWSQSNLVENRTRGILAEFITKTALGIEGGLRVEWDEFDLVTAAGLKVEVKSAAYLQSWAQARASDIKFGIGATAGDATRPNHDGLTRRRADVYVFCLLHHDRQETLDPLDLDQWTFYVVPTPTLDRYRPIAKSINLAGLATLGATPHGYRDLRAAVESAA